MANYQFDMLIYASIYAVFLVLGLCRPEIRDDFPELRGFTPVFPDESNFKERT